LYARPLGTATLWNVTVAVFDSDHRVVAAFLERAFGVTWVHPKAGERRD
jgi:hypothetical protein